MQGKIILKGKFWQHIILKLGFGHITKYETHFGGFVQTDPLISFKQYLGTVK